MPQPQILILDPAPERQTLVDQVRQRGYRCDVAQGLHDAMVQCIIRKPMLIVADMSIPGSCGEACRERLSQLPHLQHTSFLMIGTGDDMAGLSPDATAQHVLERIETLLPVTGPSPKNLPKTPATTPEPPPPPALLEMLARLAEQEADASVGVTDDTNRYGEILVRGGEPIHAVTEDGLAGPEAMAAISAMDVAEVALGPAPRAETPHTLSRAVAETTITPQPHVGPDRSTPDRADPSRVTRTDSAQAPPQKTATPPAGTDIPSPPAELLTLLEELSALGIVTRLPS